MLTCGALGPCVACVALGTNRALGPSVACVALGTNRALGSSGALRALSSCGWSSNTQ